VKDSPHEIKEECDWW